MALAALICAYRDTASGDGALRAVLPIAGRTLLERQARQAARAGARRILVLVERMPPALLAAIDRLKADGLDVLAARSADEAAESIDVNDRLLLVADGLVASQDAYDRVAEHEDAAVAVLPDASDERFERIDADSRWAGLAVTNGALLRETAAMLRDWDLQSTLLRRIVQAGAARVAPGASIAVVETPADLRTAEAGLLASGLSRNAPGLAARITAPLERLLLSLIAPRPVSAGWLLVGAAALAGASVVSAAFGYLLTGLILLLLAQPVEGTAERLAYLRLDAEVDRGWAAHLLPALAGGALMALGFALTEPYGWGALFMAGVTLTFHLARGLEMGRSRPPHEAYLPSRHLLPWALLPFGIAGQWLAGLTVLLAYVAASFFWTQHHIHKDMARQP